MRFTQDVIDCGEFYDTRRQPMYIVEADKPEHRNVNPALPVYEGEWWTLDCARVFNSEMQVPQWAKNTPSSQYIRIPMFSYNFSSQGTSVLPGLGFELATWVARHVELQRVDRIHLVMSNNVYAIEPSKHQLWLGVGVMFG